jgi:hypothetical protein
VPPAMRKHPIVGGDMSPVKQYRGTEQELMAALSSVTRNGGPSHKLGAGSLFTRFKRLLPLSICG